MKAIQTLYAGYRFRSRLEARYAVFLTNLHIEWEYEFEGFVFANGECYLPDFWLPTFDGGMFVEVKPKDFTEEEKDKCRLLCVESGLGVWLAKGRPDIRCYEVFYPTKGDYVFGDGIPNADQAEFENRMFGMSAYGEPGELVGAQYRNLLGETITAAVKAANQARFEHGEKP